MDSLLDIEYFRNVYGVVIAVLFFGGTVFVHELGHFLAAKKRGLKVERFSIGFGPRVWGWTGKDGVDYRISLFPLGGYVALPQMADMSAVEGAVEDDAEKLPKIGYADKMIVAVMGATFNVLFAIVLACILWAVGMPDNAEANRPVIGGVQRELTVNARGDKRVSPAWQAKLEPGDRILAVDGKPVATYADVTGALVLGTGRDSDGKPLALLTIERRGVKLPEPVRLTPLLADGDGLGEPRRMIGIQNAVPIRVDISKDKNAVAAKAGLRDGDRIVAVDDVPIWNIEQFRDAIALISDTAKFTVERIENGKPVTLTVTVTPELRKSRNATLVLEFADGDTRRTVELVPSPTERDIDSKEALKAPRPALMVCEGPGSDSSYADTLAAGTLVYGVAGGKSGVLDRPADFDAFKKLADNAGDGLTLFLSTTGNVSNVTLKQPVLRVKEAAMRKIVDGVSPRLEPGEPVHHAPWYYLGKSVSSMVDTIRALASPKSDVGVGQLSGVLGIARIYYDNADSLRYLLWVTILINVNLAFFNLLPIPVLDGGHMVYATVEKLRGRPLPRRFVEYLQLTFVVIIFGLMAFVLYRDFHRMNAGNGGAREQLARLLVSEPAAKTDK